MMLLLTRMSSQDNQDAATNVLSIITVVVRYCSYHADMQTLFDVSIVSKQLDFQFQYQFCLPLTFTLTLTEANVDQEFSGETFLSNTATKHPSMHLHTIQSHSLLHVRQYILMNQIDINVTKLIALKCSTFHFDSDLIKSLKTATWTMQIQSREQVIKSPEVLFFTPQN